MQEIEPEASRRPRRSGTGQPTLSACEAASTLQCAELRYSSYATPNAPRAMACRCRSTPWDFERGCGERIRSRATRRGSTTSVSSAGARHGGNPGGSPGSVTVIELSDGTVQARHGGKRVPLTRWARTMRKRPVLVRHRWCTPFCASALRVCRATARRGESCRAAAAASAWWMTAGQKRRPRKAGNAPVRNGEKLVANRDAVGLLW
jgi:hypothetical protein